ncbi:LacI family DNA-binding transcriptional regulator [Roseibium sediminis]|uniref:LacI family DNA-binding transcriptional regulator n=1 Tax=Roseibium sediminis TaxID=1775174 RepID=UPI001AD8B8DF|nr:LacI family DNA-binding transcriptional regulator [Roseibium sediminis]
MMNESVTKMQKPKINTMKELSEAIGVSRPTLSRYFQDPEAVRLTTRKKIAEALEGVDYVYNFIATRQNRKTTGMIGVIVPHFNDLFFTSLLESIDAAARAEGLTVLAQSSHGDEAQEARALEKLRSMSVDGAVIAPLGAAASDTAFASAAQDFPIVFADSRPYTELDGTDFVGTDNAQSIGAIVEYLCRGRGAPTFLGMPRLNSNAMEREQAYIDAVTREGLKPTIVEPYEFKESWDFEAFGFAVMDHHFSSQNHLSDTLLCANDRIAIGAIRAANRHGLLARGTEQTRLRIAGHDDHPLSQYMYPSLTTVAQDVDGIGQEAIRLLVCRIKGEQKPSITALKRAVLRLRESA